MMARTRQQLTKPDGPERLINPDAEQMVLGNILAREGFFARIGPLLTDDCFAVECNRRVFQLMRQIHEAGREPSLSGCFEYLIEAQKTSEEMGLPLLSELAFEAVEIANPERWATILKRKAAERRAWRVAERLRQGVESGIDAAAELASAREELRSIEGTFEGAAATIGDAVHSIGVDTLLAAPKGTVPGPWARLNNLTNDGLKPGELYLIGARPGVGKSTVCLQWALTAAAAGQRVLLVSLEMPRTDLLKRAMSAEGNIPHGLLVRGDLSREWRFRFAETLDRIEAYPLEITDKLRTLQAVIGKVASTSGLGLLVVDYLGLIDPGGRFENRNQEVSEISRRLKLAALDYNVPIIAAHQLNRAHDNENRRPQLGDLRDSGSLEQDADVVLLLDAPGSRSRSGCTDKDVVDLIIAKQRNGVRNETVSLHLEGRFCRLTEVHEEVIS